MPLVSDVEFLISRNSKIYFRIRRNSLDNIGGRTRMFTINRFIRETEKLTDHGIKTCSSNQVTGLHLDDRSYHRISFCSIKNATIWKLGPPLEVGILCM